MAMIVCRVRIGSFRSIQLPAPADGAGMAGWPVTAGTPAPARGVLAAQARIERHQEVVATLASGTNRSGPASWTRGLGASGAVPTRPAGVGRRPHAQPRDHRRPLLRGPGASDVRRPRPRPGDDRPAQAAPGRTLRRLPAAWPGPGSRIVQVGGELGEWRQASIDRPGSTSARAGSTSMSASATWPVGRSGCGSTTEMDGAGTRERCSRRSGSAIEHPVSLPLFLMGGCDLVRKPARPSTSASMAGG